MNVGCGHVIYSLRVDTVEETRVHNFLMGIVGDPLPDGVFNIAEAWVGMEMFRGSDGGIFVHTHESQPEYLVVHGERFLTAPWKRIEAL